MKGADAQVGRGEGPGDPVAGAWRGEDRGEPSRSPPMMSVKGGPPGRDGDTSPERPDFCLWVSREPGVLTGRRSRASVRGAEGRAQVLSGFTLKLPRED